MASIHPRYVLNEDGQKEAVLLSMDEWQQILDELEELDDIRAYDEAKAGSQEAVPFEQALREIEEPE